MIPAGARPYKISFQRAVTTVDDNGQEVPGVIVTVAEAFARVRYGTGQERREAAQERAEQAATFECLWSEGLADVDRTDRLMFNSEAWDIVSIAAIGLYRELHFGAVVSV